MERTRTFKTPTGFILIRPNTIKHLILGAILLTLAVFLINPNASQQVEGKKLKEKKILKTLVKGLILKNLSTKKNFLPMPVPIPGKWQQILNAIFDGGSLLLNDRSQHKKFSSDSLKGNKLPNQSTSNSLDIDAIKKYTRLAAAKYASRIISNQVPSKKGSLLAQKPAKINDKISKAVAITMGDNKSGHQKNDLLVTLFNLVKLAQQLKELDRSKLINISKKSSSILNPSKTSPVLSMNINNKKSFINKMNYIHTLTTDFNHRHRHFHNGLSFI